MAIEHITDHSDRAVALLLSQYQGKPLMEGFVRAFLDEVQEYEDELWTLVGLLDIDRATGIDLDRIGRIVVQPRSSESDDAYRRLLRARIAANRSSGTYRDLWRVSTMAFWGLGCRIEPMRDRAVIAELAVAPTGDISGAVSVLADAAPAGRSVHVHLPLDANPCFTLADGDEVQVDESRGLAGDSLDASPATGGELIDVIVGA